MKFVIVLATFLAAAFAADDYSASFRRIRDEVAQKTSLWKAGYNEFMRGKSLEDMKRLCGTKMDKSVEELLPERVSTVRANLPATFDSRTNWASCKSIAHIRDQANCGSCWAVAGAEVATDRWCIGKGGSDNPMISAEDLMTCCWFCGQGCNGGYPAMAMRWYKWFGLVTGGDYGSNVGCRPYQIAPCGAEGCSGSEASTPKCTKSCVSTYATSYKTDKHHGSSSYSVSSNPTAIQTEVMTNGPVEAAFTVYEDFMSYKSGVYHHTSGQQLGGHAVKLMGWGTEAGTDYWLVANSWNTTWGIDGTFKIRRGNDECGIESSIVAVKV